MAKKIKGSEGGGAAQKYPRDNSMWAGLLLGSIAVDCFTSWLSGIIVTGLMYVPNTRPNMLLRDCSQWALTYPLKRYKNN